MHVKEEMYKGKLIQILYPEECCLLQHNKTKLVYGSVSLKDGRQQEDYIEIEEPQPEEE